MSSKNKVKETVYYTLKGEFTYKGLSASRIPFSPNFYTIQEAKDWYNMNKGKSNERYLWSKFKSVGVYKSVISEQFIENM